MCCSYQYIYLYIVIRLTSNVRYYLEYKINIYVYTVGFIIRYTLCCLTTLNHAQLFWLVGRVVSISTCGLNYIYLRCNQNGCLVGIVVAVIIWLLDLQLLMQSMTITTKVVSSKHALDTILCNKVCQLLAAGMWFSPCTPVSSTHKTDHHGKTEIMLKVAFKHHNPSSQL